jgi:peptidoglycan hydrolase CwlO-like protein
VVLNLCCWVEQRDAFAKEQDILSEVQELKLKLDDLRALHDSVCREKDLLESHCEELEKEIQEATDVIGLLKTSRKSEQEKLHRKYEEVTAGLKKQLQEMQANHNELEVEKDILLEGIAELENRLQLFHDKNQELEAEREVLLEGIAELELKLQEATDTHHSTLQEGAQTHDKITTTYESKLSSLRHQHDMELRSVSSSKDKEIATLQLCIDDLQSEIETQERQMEELNVSVKAQVSQIQAELEALQQDNHNLKMDHAKELVIAKKTAQEEAKAPLETKINVLKGQLADLRRQNEGLVREIASESRLQQSLQESSAAQTDMEKQLANRDKEIISLNARIATLMDVMGRQQVDGEEKMRLQLNALQTENAKLQLRIEDQLAEFTEKLAKKQEELDEVTESRDYTIRTEVESHKAAAEKSKAAFEQKIFELQGRLDTAESNIKTEREIAEAQITKLKVNAVVDRSELEKQLADYAGVVNKLVQSRDKREKDVQQEKETIRARYKRNEELLERDVQETNKRLDLQAAEFLAEKEAIVQRDIRREEEFSKHREDMIQREKRLETEFKRSIDEMRSRELQREQELQMKITTLREECATKAHELQLLTDKAAKTESQLTAKLESERNSHTERVTKLETLLLQRQTEFDAQIKALRDDRDPIVEERFGMMKADMETRIFYVTELQTTVLGLWEQIQQLQNTNTSTSGKLQQSQQQLHQAEQKIASMAAEISELETALDTTELVLRESEELQSKLSAADRLRVAHETRLDGASRELLVHQHSDYELGQHLAHIGAELSKKLAEAHDVSMLHHEAAARSAVAGLPAATSHPATSPSKTDAMLESIRSRKIVNNAHDYEMSLHDACSVDTLGSDQPYAESKHNELTARPTEGRQDAVALFNSSLQFLFGHLQTITYLQSVVGRDQLLQSCGVGSSVPTSRSSSSRRLRAALARTAFPASQERQNAMEADGEAHHDWLLNGSADHSHAHPVAEGKDDVNAGAKKAADRVIYPRRPVDPLVGKRSMVVASSPGHSPMVSRQPRDNSRDGGSSTPATRTSKSPLRHKDHYTSANVDVADIGFMVDMGDTYNALMETLLNIEADTEATINEKKKELSHAHKSARNGEDPLRDIAATLLQASYTPKITTKIIRGGAGSSSDMELKLDTSTIGGVPPLSAGTGSMEGVNVLRVYDRLEKNIKVCTSGMMSLKDRLVGELHEMNSVLGTQFKQLESLGHLVIKTRESPQRSYMGSVPPSSVAKMTFSPLPANENSPHNHSSSALGLSVQDLLDSSTQMIVNAKGSEMKSRADKLVFG